MLISIQEYMANHLSPDARPSLSTVQRWCQAQKLPCIKIGRKYLIDEDQLKNVTGNDLAQRILQE